VSVYVATVGVRIVEAAERRCSQRWVALAYASVLGAALVGLALLGYYLVVQAFADRL
jgi:hypothetical protein